MTSPCHCAPLVSAPASSALDIDQFSILFDRENLCIARCNICGAWLANETGCWEPLLRYQSNQVNDSA